MNYDQIKEKDKILYLKWKTDKNFIDRISRFRVIDDVEMYFFFK